MAFIEMDFANGSGGGLNHDLLWTNPNPTSSFDAQTISLDLTNYEYVFIILHSNGTNPASGINPKPYSNCLIPVFQVSGDPSTNPTPSEANGVPVIGASSVSTVSSYISVRRGARANLSGVYFTGAMVGAGSSTNNSRGIPVYIFGIKSLGDLAKYIEGTE